MNVILIFYYRSEIHAFCHTLELSLCYIMLRNVLDSGDATSVCYEMRFSSLYTQCAAAEYGDCRIAVWMDWFEHNKQKVTEYW
jgi:hypothetical protein